MKHIYILLTLFFVLCCQQVMAQQASISGKVTRAGSGQPLSEVQLYLQHTRFSARSDAEGNYSIAGIRKGTYTLVTFMTGLKSVSKQVIVVEQADVVVNFELDSLTNTLEEVTVSASSEYSFGIARLNAVEGTAIYEAKKTEVIKPGDLNANLAGNISRQIFAKIAGVHVWESDGGGIQLGVSTRGLNPNRTSEFNTRQNGYDISADALGYPEAYYTPPAEALEKIEVVRGAASLQYGTQFGGMINFVMKKGTEKKAIEVDTRQTVGSFGFFSSFNSAGGTKKFKNGRELNHYSFYQLKRGDGWRENSEFNVHTAYTGWIYKHNDKLSVAFDYTYMDYLAKQPGGLTDREFRENPRTSYRDRNWFSLDWNLASLKIDYKFSTKTKLNIRNFGLVAQRSALGSLENAGRVDNVARNRDLMVDDYRNFGSEIRLIHNYNLLKIKSVMLVGTRIYKGFTHRRQGDASSDNRPVFKFLNPDALEHSNFDFPSTNVSVFAENIFNITDQFSITPGIRYEYIKTESMGYYNEYIIKGFKDNVPVYEKYRRSGDLEPRVRSFALLGLGLSYRPKDNMEIYANYSQNYRAINFNDLRVFNPNIRVDPNMKDENGFNMDLGYRGNIRHLLNYDVSAFYLAYNDRIGSVLVDNYRLRKNIADTKTFGVETFVEADLMKLVYGDDARFSLSVFSNVTYLNARYKSDEKRFQDKQVEMAVPLLVKTGATFRKNFSHSKYFSATMQYSYTSRHFTDASNAISTPTAIEGEIPAYHVLDLSATYNYKFMNISAGINNLTNNMYFTRRAITYPGPGLIPASGRNWYLTVAFKF